MSGFRLTPEIIDAALSLPNTLPADGEMPVWRTISVHVGIGNTMSADHPQVATGNPLKIPAGFLPVAPDQIIPTDPAGSGWRFQNFAGTRRYLLQFRLLAAMILD